MRKATAAATPHPVLPSISATRGGRAAWNLGSCGARRQRRRRQQGLQAAQAETHVGQPLLSRMPLPPLHSLRGLMGFWAGGAAALAAAADRWQEEEEGKASRT